MCAACIDPRKPDAPPVDALIAAIKQQLRRRRTVTWGLRALALVSGVLAVASTSMAFAGAYSLWLVVASDMLIAWYALHLAEDAAERCDQSRDHLRLTEALKDEPKL